MHKDTSQIFLGGWQESSKGKSVMPAHFFPNRTSPSLSIPIKRSSPSQPPAQPHDYISSQGFAAHSSGTSQTKDNSQHSREGSHHSTEGSHHSGTGRSDSRGSSHSASSKNVSVSGRSVRFDLPSSLDECSHGSGHTLLTSEVYEQGKQTVADDRVHSQALNSSPVPIAFR